MKYKPGFLKRFFSLFSLTSALNNINEGESKKNIDSTLDESELTEYSFIFYKKIKANKTNYYTKPFRIKQKGKTFTEARDKAVEVILRQYTLVIVEECSFKDTELGKLNAKFGEMEDHLNEMIKDTFSK